MRGALNSSTRTCRALSPALTISTCSAISPTRRRGVAVGRVVQCPSETEMAPKAQRLLQARDRFEQKLPGWTGDPIPVDKLLAIAPSCSRRRRPSGHGGTHQQRRSLAAWARVAQHPGPGELVRVGRGNSRDWRRFSNAGRSSRAAGKRSPSRRRRTSSLVVREHVDAGAVRVEASRACYLTDVDRWPADRQDELARHNFPTLWSISIHESIPATSCTTSIFAASSQGAQSILFAPASFVEGWAHYCER
jgi:hypothetical protein